MTKRSELRTVEGFGHGGIDSCLLWWKCTYFFKHFTFANFDTAH
jgi:hypothetical protein